MLDTKNPDFSKLLVNAKNVGKDLEEWQKDPSLQKKRDELVRALKSTEEEHYLQHPIFKDEQYPVYALMAYQNEEISLEQMTSVAINWCAFSDYSKDMVKIKHHQLKQGDLATQRELVQFLNLQTTPFVNQEQKLSLQNRQAIFDQLYQPNVPASERCFIIFELKDKKTLAPILRRILELGFTYFMPIPKGSGYRVLIPSFTMIKIGFAPVGFQSFSFIPKIGDDAANDVFQMHEANEHPFGISFPGHEHDEADGLKAGKFGFILHELYHIFILQHNELLKAINALVKLGNAFTDQQTSTQNTTLTLAVNTMIDGEFREFTAQAQPQKMIPNNFNIKEILSNEVKFFLCISRAFFFHNQAKLLQENPDNITIHPDGNLQNLMVNPLSSVNLKDDEEIIKKLIAFWFADIFNNPSKWKELGVNITTLVNFLDESSQASIMFNKAMEETDNLLSKGTIGFMQDAINVTRSVFKQILFQSNLNQDHGKSWCETFLRLKDELFALAKSPHTTVDMLNDFYVRNKVDEYLENIDMTDEHGQTALHYALKNNPSPEVTQWFLQKGADKNRICGPSQKSIGDVLGTRPLHLAAQHQPMLVAVLLEEGADPYVYDHEKRSPVGISIERGDVPTLKTFLTVVSLSAPYLAYLQQNNKIHANCQALLQDYASFKKELDNEDLKYKDNALEIFSRIPNSHQFNWDTCLDNKFSEENEYAYRFDHGSYQSLVEASSPQLLQVLIVEKKCKVNRRNREGKTPLLHYGAKSWYGHDELECINILLENGASVNEEDNQGNTFLGLVIGKGDVSIVEKLKSFPQKMSHISIYEKLLLKLIQQDAGKQWSNSAIALFKAVVECGFDLNTKIPMPKNVSANLFVKEQMQLTMQTPWSLIRNFPIMVQASFSIFRSSQLGRLNAPIELRKFCVEKGADPNQNDYAGNPELITAVRNNWLDYAKLLVSKGADVNITDNEGNSPLHVAAEFNKTDFVILFLQAGALQFENNKDETPRSVAEINYHVDCIELLDPMFVKDVEKKQKVATVK